MAKGLQRVSALCDNQNQAALLTFRQVNWKFCFRWKQKVISLLPDICKTLNPFLLLNSVSITRVAAHFIQASLSRQLEMFVLACQTSTTCAMALPHWFCPLNLQLTSIIAFWSDCQMTCRGLNLDSSWTLLPDQLVAKVYLLPRPKINFVDSF